MKTSIVIILFIGVCFASCSSQNSDNRKVSNDTLNKKRLIPQTIVSQERAKYSNVKSIPVPKGYVRIEVEEGSFGEYLRNLELKTEDNKVYLYNGSLKYNQSAQFAVLKIDVGTRDLQQCADAVMRLRGEYLYVQKKYSDIHFNFLSDGKPRYFKTYAKGDFSHKKFRRYMDYIFSYANTASLKKELVPVDNSKKNIKPGDVFIQSGKPYGHAVTVVDAAKNDKDEIIFMLAQSYMPAQDIHILKNPNNENLSPWYNFSDTDYLIIPEWKFNYSDLRRF